MSDVIEIVVTDEKSLLMGLHGLQMIAYGHTDIRTHTAMYPVLWILNVNDADFIFSYVRPNVWYAYVGTLNSKPFHVTEGSQAVSCLIAVDIMDTSHIERIPFKIVDRRFADDA